VVAPGQFYRNNVLTVNCGSPWQSLIEAVKYVPYSESWKNKVVKIPRYLTICRILQFQQKIVNCSTFKDTAELGTVASDDADTLNL
jgi:hypothetical protein